MAPADGQSDAAPAIEQPLPDRITLIAEHLDPRRDLAVVGGLTLIQSLVELGVRVRVLAGYCPGWAVPEGAELEQLGGVPAPMHRVVRWQRWCKAHASSAEHGPVLSLSPMVRGDVNLLLDGTQRSRIMCAAVPRDGGAAAVRRAMALVKPRNLLRLTYERQALKHEQAVIATTDADLRDRRYDAEVNAALLPLAVPAAPAELATADEQRAKLCRGLCIPLDAPLILFPSTQPRADGFGPMMLALGQMRERGGSAVVLLAGQYRYTHLSWIAELGLRDAVRFAGPTRRLGLLYAVCDVVAHPTGRDGSGQAGLLAIAAGKPVVTTRACAMAGLIDPARSLVTASGCGVLLDPGFGPEALATALDGALEPAKQTDWAKTCGKIAAQHTPQGQARAVLGLLSSAKSRSSLASGGESD